MKATYNQILSAREALAKLSDKALPIKESVHLARLIKKLNSELEVFNDKQGQLFKKYGNPDDEGVYTIEQKNHAAFEAELKQLLDVEFDLGCDKVHIASNIDIEASVIIATESFIEFITE